MNKKRILLAAVLGTLGIAAYAASQQANEPPIQMNEPDVMLEFGTRPDRRGRNIRGDILNQYRTARNNYRTDDM